MRKVHITTKMASCKNNNKRKPGKINCNLSKKRFCWTQEMIKELITCLSSYKSSMEYDGKDFNADKPLQYECIRRSMTEIFPDDDYDAFGPLEIIASKDLENLDEEDNAKEMATLMKAKIRIGYNRILEKIKEIRQNFNAAVEKGTRSGSGRIILEYYDQLASIYKGSPSTEQIPFGLDTDIASEKRGDSANEDIQAEVPLTNDDDEQSGDDNDQDEPIIKRKKSSDCNVVPKLIDDKRRHMERRLSAAQRDQLLLKESREETETKRELVKVIRESAEISARSFEKLTEGFLSIGQGLTQAVGLLAQSMTQNNNPSFHRSDNSGYNGIGNAQQHFEIRSPNGRGPPTYSRSCDSVRPNIDLIYRNLDG